MTKWILGLALMIAMAVPATAAAEPAATAAGDIPIAEAFWGGPPTQCGSVTVTYSPPAAVAGLATQPAPGEHDIPCEMALTEVGAILPTVTGAIYGAEYVCLITVHEEGHLHGFGHVADPEAIMYSGLLSATEVPECVGGAITGPPIERGHLRMTNLTKILRYHRRHHVHRGATL